MHIDEIDAGVLDIHGRVRRRVWTFLAASTLEGTTTVVTREPVDYEAGDRIVVTSSSHNFEEAEERIVVSRSIDGYTITVDKPFQHSHRVDIFAHDGESVYLGCEVGLLSRNVVIQGDEQSEVQLFGSHTIAVHGGTMRIENAEVRHCGQSFNLGRYCVHYHEAETQTASYVRANSIHDSFQRAVVAHATHQLVIADNLAYHVRGHTYFIEDGV
jgi:hypothetical protein